MLLGVTKDEQAITSDTITHAQNDYNTALALYQQKQQETQSYQNALDTANTDLANKTAVQDTALANLNAAIQALNDAQSAKDTKQTAYDTAYNDYIAAQSAYDSASTVLNNAKTLEAQTNQDLIDAQNTLSAKQDVLNNKIAATQAIQAAIATLNSQIQADQTSLTQTQQNLNGALSDEQAAQTDYNNAQADVNAKQAAYNNAVQAAQTAQAALNTANTNLTNAQQAQVVAQNALSDNGAPYVVSSYTYSPTSIVLSQYKNFISDNFSSYNSTIWYKPADTLVTIGGNAAILKGTGRNYNATFYTNQSYNMTDEPVLTTSFKVSSASGRFIAALDGYTSSSVYRRVGIYVQNGNIYLQTVSGKTTTNVATLISGAKANTNYNLEFDVTSQDIKVYLWVATGQKPANPSYTYTVNDWAAVRPYFSLYSGTATINSVTLKGPSYTSTYNSNSQLAQDAYQDGSVSTYSYSSNSIKVSDYLQYLSQPYDLTTANLWYKATTAPVTISNGVAILNGTGSNYNATFYSNQTFIRSNNVLVSSNFKVTSASSKFIDALDGYTSLGAYRRVGVTVQGGKIYVQTVSGSSTSTPATLIATAKINTNYTVEFQATTQNILIYIWESTAQRPTNPSYIYTATNWATVRPYFSDYSGTATVSNVYINYIPQAHTVSSTSSEYNQILARNQLVNNLNNAIVNVNFAQTSYGTANAVLTNANAVKSQAQQDLASAQTTLATKQTILNNKIAAVQAIQTTINNINSEIATYQGQLSQNQQNLNGALSDEQAAQSDYNNAQTNINAKQTAYDNAVQDEQTKETALNAANTDLTTKIAVKNKTFVDLQIAVQNFTNAQTAKDVSQTVYNSASADYVASQNAYNQALADFNNEKSNEDSAKAQANSLLAILNTLLSISLLFPSQDTVLKNADNNLGVVSVLYGAGRQIQQVNHMDGTTENYINGLPGNISNSSEAILYSYDLNALNNINDITVDSDGIKRIYDSYGNLQSISLNGITQVVYENGDYVTMTYWQSGNKGEEQFFNSGGVLQDTLDYYDSAAGRLAAETLASPDSSGMIYYHYIDENWNNQGYGRVDKFISQTPLNGELTYADSGELVYSGELSYSYSYYSDTGLLQTKNAYSDSNWTTLVATYNYYNDSTNRLQSKIEPATGITYTYYNDPSGYVESKILVSPDLLGNIYYHYIDENWNSRGYGRIDKSTMQSSVNGELSYFYSYYNDATGFLQTKNAYSDSDQTILVATYAYYNDSTNRLVSKTDATTGIISTCYNYYYGDSGYVESRTLPSPDSNGNIYYHYIDENWNNRGYGRVDESVRQASNNGELSYSYSYADNISSNPSTIQVYSDNNWTEFKAAYSKDFDPNLTNTYYASGCLESQTYVSTFSNSEYSWIDTSYNHYIDENWYGLGYGRLDKALLWRSGSMYVNDDVRYYYNDNTNCPVAMVEHLDSYDYVLGVQGTVVVITTVITHGDPIRYPAGGFYYYVTGYDYIVSDQIFPDGSSEHWEINNSPITTYDGPTSDFEDAPRDINLRSDLQQQVSDLNNTDENLTPSTDSQQQQIDNLNQYPISADKPQIDLSGFRSYYDLETALGEMYGTGQQVDKLSSTIDRLNNFLTIGNQLVSINADISGGVTLTGTTLDGANIKISSYSGEPFFGDINTPPWLGVFNGSNGYVQGNISVKNGTTVEASLTIITGPTSFNRQVVSSDLIQSRNDVGSYTNVSTATFDFTNYNFTGEGVGGFYFGIGSDTINSITQLKTSSESIVYLPMEVMEGQRAPVTDTETYGKLLYDIYYNGKQSLSPIEANLIQTKTQEIVQDTLQNVTGVTQNDINTIATAQSAEIINIGQGIISYDSTK